MTELSSILAPLLVSGEVFDDLDELVGAVSVLACEVEELSSVLDNRAAFRCSGNRDAAAAAEFAQAFVAELAESAEDGVGVDAEDGGEISCWRQAFSRLGLSLGDRASNLTGDLFVQIGGVRSIYLDIF